MEYRSTRQVAALLGVQLSVLTKATWSGRVSPPEKSPSGAFLWSEDDIQRASWALRRRSADDVLPEHAEEGARRG